LLKNGIVKKMEPNTHKVEISYKTVVFTALFLILLWFLYQIKEILLALFISLILTGALNPTVNRLERLKIPRWLSIIIIYLFLIGLLVAMVSFIIPSLVDQTSRLVQAAVDLAERLSFLGLSPEKLQSQLQELGGVPSQILKLVISLFSNIVAVFAIMVITFYLLIEHKNLDKHLFFFFGSAGEGRAKRVIYKLEKKLGGWIRAQLFLMVFVGGFSYLGFRILNLKFALPLAIIAGLLEIIPNIGPTLAAVPAVLVGLMVSPLMGLLALTWAFIVQQVENSILVPKIMQQSTGVNPIITILVLAIGFKLAGVIGAILAIPIYLSFEILASEFFFLKEKKA